MDPAAEYLDDILKKLLEVNLEVGAAALVSMEGLPIASALPRGADETRSAVMTSALFSLGKRLVIEMRKGNFDQICMKGSEGYLLVAQAGSDAIMLLSTTKQINKLDFNMFSRLGPSKPPGSPGATAAAEKDL